MNFKIVYLIFLCLFFNTIKSFSFAVTSISLECQDVAVSAPDRIEVFTEAKLQISGTANPSEIIFLIVTWQDNRQENFSERTNLSGNWKFTTTRLIGELYTSRPVTVEVTDLTTGSTISRITSCPSFKGKTVCNGTDPLTLALLLKYFK